MHEHYRDRALSARYPELASLASKYYSGTQSERADDTPRVERLLTLLSRLMKFSPRSSICVLGCGPVPQIIRILRERGFDARGIEPVPSFVATAAEYVGETGIVFTGSAEEIPLPSESQDVVLFENVLEHVDSVGQSLREIYRVLAPGGVAYITTQNRHEISLLGRKGEFNVRYYNWLPSVVKECYIFRHLHYDPTLANYTERPAVHWFTYADLCRLGREAGFAFFYSPLDVTDGSDVASSPNPVKRGLQRSGVLRLIQQRPWLRALALTWLGANIFMVKRQREVSVPQQGFRLFERNGVASNESRNATILA